MDSHSRRGLLLLDVLMAVVIVSVALITVAQAMGSAARAGRAAERYTEAITLAEDRLWEHALRVTVAGLDPLADEGTFADPFVDRRWTIARRALELTPPTLEEVTITITWGAEDHARSLIVSTFLPEPVL